MFSSCMNKFLSFQKLEFYFEFTNFAQFYRLKGGGGVRSKFLGEEGVVDGEGGSSEGCLKWGGGEWRVIEGSFQKHLKTGGG